MKNKKISIIMAAMITVSSLLVPKVSAAAGNNISVERIYGSNRYETAIKISERDFDMATYAVVASGEKYADALVGGTLAVQGDGPIFLTSKNAIDKATLREIKMLNIKKVFLLGGENTISKTVEQDINKIAEVERLAGKDRFETANKIATARYKISFPHFENAMGDLSASISPKSFADALTAAPFVAQLKTDADIYTYLNFYGNSLPPYMVIGGHNSVPKLDSEEYRFYGSNRYHTAVEVAKAYKTHLNKDIKTVVLASGINYPDALASAPLVVNQDGVLLLTSPNKLSEETRKYIKEQKVQKVIIVGGKNSVSNQVVKDIKNIEFTENEKIVVDNPTLPNKK